MNTNNTTANTTTFLDSWDDLLKLEKPLDFEAFLNSDLLATKRNQINTRGIIFHATGTVSTIVSTCLIVHILRSHHGLSTTYHRLVFGICIADIMSSFAFVLGSTMAPKEMNYFVPGAQGTTTTCTAQRFTLFVGSTIVVFVSITFQSSGIIRRMNTFGGTSWNPGFMGYLS
jgi:hypothetical protein